MVKQLLSIAALLLAMCLPADLAAQEVSTPQNAAPADPPQPPAGAPGTIWEGFNAGPSAVEAAKTPSMPPVEMRILLLPLTQAELHSLADIWQGYLRRSLEEVAWINRSLLRAGTGLAEDLRAELLKLSKVQKGLKENYALVLDEWERKGGAEDQVALHRAYVEALTVKSVKITDYHTILTLIKQWTLSMNGGLGILLSIVAFLAAIWVVSLVAGLAKRLAARTVGHSQGASQLWRAFVQKSVFWATFALGTVLVLAMFGIEIAPFLAVFGGVSFIIGFAMQETLGNAVSGFIIMVTKPFDIGDYIKTEAVSGIVEKMSGLSTRIRTFDNQVIMVPNTKVWNGVITNVNASSTRRVDLMFPIASTENRARAIAAIKDVVATHEKCLDDPVAQVFVGDIQENAVSIYCRPWVKTADHWSVYVDLMGQIKDRLDAEGIAIPVQLREITVRQATEA